MQDGYPVTALSHSPSGDRFIVGTGSSQPKVYDREGVELMKFVKGDMYLRDLSNTKVCVLVENINSLIIKSYRGVFLLKTLILSSLNPITSVFILTCSRCVCDYYLIMPNAKLYHENSSFVSYRVTRWKSPG